MFIFGSFLLHGCFGAYLCAGGGEYALNRGERTPVGLRLTPVGLRLTPVPSECRIFWAHRLTYKAGKATLPPCCTQPEVKKQTISHDIARLSLPGLR